MGSELTGVLYVLDEPSIGLHQRDNIRLLNTLSHLRDIGNTVIVIEHDRETIETADWVLDLGPGAGHLGGQVVAAGTPKQIRRNRASLTGRYLSGKERIETPEERRTPKDKGNKWVTITRASENNLKGIKVDIPLGLLVSVTGVSGAGKSTLVSQILYPALARRLHASTLPVGKHGNIQGLANLDKVINIDQKPIGRTPRSNPATYTKVFDPIRDLFALIPDSRARGYKKGRYSFNVKGGRCEACKGDGHIRIEMHFLADVFVPCEVCKARRFNASTLEIRYKGHSIADVLDLSVAQAFDLFAHQPRIATILGTLKQVGLSYIKLGQSATTLSGGEAQRVKLARELSKRDTGRTLYILDEPTTGLHFDDIKMLLRVLQSLVDSGNTVVIIEHNLDVIKTADWIIDLGPEGGEEGGYVVAAGPPEEVVKVQGELYGAVSTSCALTRAGRTDHPRNRRAKVSSVMYANAKATTGIVTQTKTSFSRSMASVSLFPVRTLFRLGGSRWIICRPPLRCSFKSCVEASWFTLLLKMRAILPATRRMPLTAMSYTERSLLSTGKTKAE